MTENPDESEENGLRGRLRKLQESESGCQEEEARETTEEQPSTEESVKDSRETAIRLIKEGKMGFDEISEASGLSKEQVWGLKGVLTRRGELQGKEAGEEPPRHGPQRPPSPEEQMHEEMSSTLREELSVVPGAGQGTTTEYVVRRFNQDSRYSMDPNELHYLLARSYPKLHDDDVKDLVQTVFRIQEQYGFDRLRGLRPRYPPMLRGLDRGGYSSDYRGPGYGYEQPAKTYTQEDIKNERKLWNIERRQDELNNFLGKTNETLEKILEKTERPQLPSAAESDSMKKLEDRIERLQESLVKKDKELDEQQRQVLKDQLAELRQEVHGLRGSLNDFKSDEFRLIGTVLDKGVDFGKEILREAPASRAAQQIAAAMKPGQPSEVPPEARKTVLEVLKSEGLTVPE